MPLIVDRPGEGLEDRIACTVLGMAEHRVTAVAPDHEGLAGLKRTPVGVVSVRGIAAILGIVDRQSFTGRARSGDGHVKGIDVFAARLVGADRDPLTIRIHGRQGALAGIGADRIARRISGFITHMSSIR